MKYRLLDLLICPVCKKKLVLHVFKEIKEGLDIKGEKKSQPICKIYCGYKNFFFQGSECYENEYEVDCLECYQKEITDGLLICNCGAIYPIYKCVPRLLDNNPKSFPEFFIKNKEKINVITKSFKSREVEFRLSEEFESIHRSFSKEWSFFDYEEDKTWGWDMEERKRIFLDDFGLDGSAFHEKLLLDAGCGNGKLTSAVSDFGAEVVGMDISNSVERAHLEKKNYSRNRGCYTHFIQGSLSTPPFDERTFDYIYSSGVLHHTPDTKKTFLQVIPMIKQGGRVYIWVYSKRKFFVRAWMAHGRLLRDYISLKSLFYYCRIISPIYKAAAQMLTALNISKFRERTTREIALDLFDAFSPSYNHTHSQEEVCEWFKEQNYINISVCGFQKHGFGVRGDKK